MPPHCGFLDVIKKGKRSGHTRYYCKSCGSYFTDRRTSVCLKNKEVWFREWVIGKQTIEQLASRSNYSVRHLKSYFYQMLPLCPVWHIQHREKVNLLIDGTYFPNKVCLVLYRDANIHMTLFYRLTAGERFWELQQDLRAIKALQIQIESVTCDGDSAILKAVQEVCPEAILQRCTVHIAREIETWITRKPKSQAARELLELVHLLGRVEDQSDAQLWMRAFIDRYWNWETFINAKSTDEESGRWWFTHRMIHRSATHIKRASPLYVQLYAFPQCAILQLDRGFFRSFERQSAYPPRAIRNSLQGFCQVVFILPIQYRKDTKTKARITSILAP